MSDEAKPFDPRGPLDPSRALVPSVIQVNEVRVQQGFWPKMRRVATRIPFAKDILAVYFSARDDETPLRAKGLMFAALAYFVLPTDAIPDIITGLGFTDDAAVLFALMNVVGRSVKPRHKQQADETLHRFSGED
jgi:uncharacterized membrane protein YkvA (DUF1232 family)